jgi:uncharacterized protein YjeT (DUF2065 family)
VSTLIAVLIGLLPLVLIAQPVTQPSTQPAGQMPGMGMGSQGQGQSGQMDKMDKMAESMTAMAQMCQTMMQREDATLRRALIGACIVGVLLVIALILFIILEVQWIRFFAVRIATERRKLNLETK